MLTSNELAWVRMVCKCSGRESQLTSPMYSMMNCPALRSTGENRPKPFAPARLCRGAMRCQTRDEVLQL